MSTVEETLGSFVASLSYARIPDRVRDTARRAVLDTVGVTIAGTTADAGAIASTTAGVAPDSTAVGTILGLSGEQRPAERALRVGVASHALDYDDLCWGMDGHPSVTLVPPLFALADEADASGEDLLTAYVAGFEVECALAGPVSPDHYEAGWHATATFGAFGAAAATASLLDLTAEQARHALNVAASTPAGLKRNFGSMTKPLHAGLCSRSGVTATLLARNGFTADAAALSGERGFWDLYGPSERDPFEFDAEVWALDDHGIHVKYYPCCYFTHTSIAATRALVTEHDVEPRDIERIDVRASRGAADALHHADPQTGLEAKFSMEYAVACGAARDRVGLDAFEDDRVDDPTVQRVRERVDFAVDESLPYDSHEAFVRLETADDTVERTQTNPPGTYDDPLTDAELRQKFTECARRTLSADVVDSLADTLETIDEYDSVVDALCE